MGASPLSSGYFPCSLMWSKSRLKRIEEVHRVEGRAGRWCLTVKCKWKYKLKSRKESDKKIRSCTKTGFEFKLDSDLSVSVGCNQVGFGFDCGLVRLFESGKELTWWRWTHSSCRFKFKQTWADSSEDHHFRYPWCSQYIYHIIFQSQPQIR